MENNSLSTYSSLLRQIPHVLRARGFRLYLANGKRLIDLWLNGGTAVLGHTPPNLLREIKNSASRGLYAPYPHFTESRYIKALSKILPGRSFRLYAAPPKELNELFNEGKAKLWRPFIDPANPFATNNTPFLIPILPGIQTWRGDLPFGLCAAAAKSEDMLTQLPESDSFSPILLAAAARGIYDILASPERAKPKLPRTFKALKNLTGRWQRRGIYLKWHNEPLCKENECTLSPCLEEWTALFHQFMEAGFLLPPTPAHPLILPNEISDGEEKKLASVLSA